MRGAGGTSRETTVGKGNGGTSHWQSQASAELPSLKPPAESKSWRQTEPRAGMWGRAGLQATQRGAGWLCWQCWQGHTCSPVFPVQLPTAAASQSWGKKGTPGKRKRSEEKKSGPFRRQSHLSCALPPEVNAAVTRVSSDPSVFAWLQHGSPMLEYCTATQAAKGFLSHCCLLRCRLSLAAAALTVRI